MPMELKWLKNPGKLPFAFYVFLLVFITTIIALGEVLSEKWVAFKLRA